MSLYPRGNMAEVIDDRLPEPVLRPTIEHQLIAKALNNMFVQAQQAGHEPHQLGPIRIANMNRGKGAPEYSAIASVRTFVVGYAKMEEGK